MSGLSNEKSTMSRALRVILCHEACWCQRGLCCPNAGHGREANAVLECERGRTESQWHEQGVYRAAEETFMVKNSPVCSCGDYGFELHVLKPRDATVESCRQGGGAVCLFVSLFV